MFIRKKKTGCSSHLMNAIIACRLIMIFAIYIPDIGTTHGLLKTRRPDIPPFSEKIRRATFSRRLRRFSN